MNKAHSNINWENYPSGNTPINDENLNKMDISIDTIDDRVITLDTTKANKIEVAQLIKDISFDESTGVFTITKKDGSKFTIDTKLEKIAVNFAYDTELQQIMLTLVDGTIERIDLSDFVTQYEFLDTDTITFSTDTYGNVSASIKEGSVEEKHLRPDYLAEIKVEAAKAQLSASNAAKSEIGAKESENAAKVSQEEAENSATSSSASAAIATQKATESETYAENAKTSEDNAKNSQTAAKESETNAENFERATATNANSALASATNADNYAKKSQSYAIGTGNVRPNESTDSAKYYYEQSKNIYDNFSSAGNVTGVKGNLESTYRAGNVNLTAENIGAVNKGGDTMNGELIVLSSRSTTKAPSLPFCGRVDNGIYAVENLSNYRTFLGSYYDEDGMWWNAISIRHGNGWNDGNNFGLYLRSGLMTTKGRTGNLLWGKQTGASSGWISERVILDDVNFKDYCLPLSGGTMKDDVTVAFKSTNGIGTQLDLQGGTYRANIKPAELILSNGNKQIYVQTNHGANHPTIKLIDTDINIDYDENVEINSSSIKITDNSTSETLKIGASKIVEENTLLYLGSNNNMFGFVINGASKYIYSGQSVNDMYDLGTSGHKWKNIYAQNGTIQTSDRTRKTDINNLDTQKAQSFINGLTPVSYKMIDGTSGRTHYGFIAQDIEELMNTLNMDSSDFAGFIKSPKKIIKYEDENGKKLENPIEEIIEGEYDYSLRYDEFIAPLIKVVQEQQREIEELKEDIKFLKEYIYAR